MDYDPRCLEKQLLEHFSPPGQPMACYRKWLKSTLNLGVNHGNLSSLQDDLLGKFYSLGHPERCPKYFKLFEGSSLAFLEEALNIRIVIVRKRQRQSKFVKLNDRRFFDKIVLQPRKCHFFELMDVRGKQMIVERDEESLGYSPFASEILFSAISVQLGNCFWESFCQLMSLQCPEGHNHSTGCATLKGFLSGGCKDLAESINVPLMLVTHLRANGTPDKRGPQLVARKQMFGQLCFFPLGRSMETVRVICMTYDDKIYLPTKIYSDVCKKIPSRTGIRGETMPPPFEDIAKQQRKQKPPSRKMESCRCKPCGEAVNFEKNMNHSGPPKQFVTKLSTNDLLKILALDSKENLAAVETCAKLACCYFDTEAESLQLDPDVGNEQAAFPFTPVSENKVPGYATAIQKTIFIGMMDGGDLAAGRPPEITRVTKEKSEERLIRDFAERVEEKKEESVVARYELLHGIFEVIDSYKETFMNYFAEKGWLEEEDPLPFPPEEEEYLAPPSSSSSDVEYSSGSDDDDYAPRHQHQRERRRKPKVYTTREIRADRMTKNRNRILGAWRANLIGQLEESLTRLATDYYVFAFNAERWVCG
jgi:hypothetical protein